jgi:Zn ribbon nucleic-acid-binding protein
MATINQHNNLLLKVFDENKHVKHVLKNEDIKRMAVVEGRFPFSKLPVCNHCEKLGMWHRDSLGNPVGFCNACGTISKKAMTYSEYLAKGLDIDETGANFRALAQKDKDKEKANRIVYLPEYNI